MRVYAYFWPFQRRGCVARTGFAAMHTLSFRTRWRIRIVSTVFCLRCAYIFSNHSGHAWHNKIDVYVRPSSAKKLHRLIQTHTITQTRVRNPLSLCRESAPFCALHRLFFKKTHCTGTFKTYTITQTSKRKRCLCADNMQFCASCRVVEHKFNPCAQNMEFSCVS